MGRHSGLEVAATGGRERDRGYQRYPPVDEPDELLLSRLKEKMIDLAPDFQRRAGIWSDVQQSRLIESLLLSRARSAPREP